MSENKKSTIKFRDVAQSIRESGIRRYHPREWDGLTGYVWRAAPKGYTEPWEGGLALALCAQQICRFFSGCEVVPIRYCDPVPLKARADKPVEPLDRYESSGYSKDMTQRNGGYGGCHPSLQDDDGGRPLLGVTAYSSIAGAGGIPELGWYFCASDFELGMGCDMIANLLGLKSTSASSAPTGPGPHQTDAATLQRAIRAALKQLRPERLALLERAYKDRAVDARLVEKHGEGVAALVSWGIDAKCVFLGSQAGEASKAIAELMARLSGVKRRAGNDWLPIPAHEARSLLAVAHADYLRARGERSKSRPPRYPPGPAMVCDPLPIAAVPPSNAPAYEAA